MKARSPERSDGDIVPPQNLDWLSVGALRLSLAAREAHIGSRRIALDEVECRILRLLIEQRPHVVTRTDLMKEAWGSASARSSAAVDELMLALQAKLGEEVRITIFPGIGYTID